MGEYGTYKGEEIKIGTCEDMYYMRADQIPLVESATLRDLTAIRFRFPFPDEDGIEPGNFDDCDRGARVWGIEPPADLDRHYKVQFKAQAGILVSLPCPYSQEAKDSGVKYHFNGYRGPVKIVQQRVWAGVWVTVCECGACGARYRLPTLDDVRPVLDACERHAKAEERVGGNPSQAKWWREVARRIEIGYSTPTNSDPAN